MGQDLRTDAAKIRAATEDALRKADQAGARSIAFPALGTGVGGFPVPECARIMLEAVRGYAAGGTGIQRVLFVLYDRTAYEAFQRALEGA